MFLALIINCSDKKAEEKIAEFDRILGKENIATLNYLISDFENDFLKSQYPNLNTENAYEQFLIEIRDGKTNYWKRISQKARDKFKSSDLRLEIYEFPDSVWIEGNDIKSRFAYKNDDGSTDYGIGFHSVNLKVNIDSLIQAEYNTSRLNYAGKYMQAIDKIKNENGFLEIFYDVKNTAGYIHPEIMAEILLKQKPDFANRIVKSLIVSEFVY